MNKSNTTRYITFLDPVRKTQEIFNSKWKLQIIITLLAGNSRFNEIGRSLPQISSKMLTKELRELEAFAVVKRTASDIKQDVNYSIENNYHELRQIVAAYKKFSIALSKQTQAPQLSHANNATAISSFV